LCTGSNFERDGFDVAPALLPDPDVDALLAALAENPLIRSRAGIRHAMQNPAVAELARDSRICGLANSLLRGQAIPYRATLFDKSPDSNWLVVWHQDTALPRREEKPSPGWGPWSRKEGVHYAHAPARALCEIVALRLHLDDSTAENGPLRVLPGTHTLGVLSDDALHVLSEQVQPVDCLTAKGGVVAMRPLLVHASSKSKSDRPRRVLHIEYTSTAAFEDLQLVIA
jgi:ectoine hydroxylase-related dioxygenase (phytanoyl-CoA dioxygenase family)